MVVTDRFHCTMYIMLLLSGLQGNWRHKKVVVKGEPPIAHIILGLISNTMQIITFVKTIHDCQEWLVQILALVPRWHEIIYMTGQLIHKGRHEQDGGYQYIDWLVQERRNPIANAPELRLSCTNPSISLLVWVLLYQPTKYTIKFAICASLEGILSSWLPWWASARLPWNPLS